MTGTTIDLIYGLNAITEALKAGRRRVFEILTTSEKLLPENAGDCPFQITTPHRLDALTHGASHQNIVARAEPYRYSGLQEILAEDRVKDLILLLDGVTDPQNFGTLCRSALVFGVKTVIIPQDRAAIVTGAVCKASSGAVEHLQLVHAVNLARAMGQLKEKGYWLYGTTVNPAASSIRTCRPAAKSAVVLGSEGKGLRRLSQKTCDVLVTIPMAGAFESLNVAQAGSVVLYEFSTQMALSC